MTWTETEQEAYRYALRWKAAYDDAAEKLEAVVALVDSDQKWVHVNVLADAIRLGEDDEDDAAPSQGAQDAVSRDSRPARVGQGGAGQGRPAGRRWRIQRWTKDSPWQADASDCTFPAGGGCRCRVFLTQPDALTYVNQQIRADALAAIQNSEVTC